MLFGTIPLLVCRREIHLEITRSLCPVLSLNEALLRVIRDRLSKRTFVVKQETKIVLMTSVSWLTVQCREHLECGVAAGRRLIGRGIARTPRRRTQLVYEATE